MMSVHDIVVINRQYNHSPLAAAMSIHEQVIKSLITINPSSLLPQTPDQVRWERDSLLMSVHSLQLKIERLKKTNKAKDLLLRRLKDKVDAIQLKQSEEM